MISPLLGMASRYTQWTQMSILPSSCSWLVWLKLGQLTSLSRDFKIWGRYRHWGLLELSQEEDSNRGTVQAPVLLLSRMLLSYSTPWVSLTSFFFVYVSQSCFHCLQTKDRATVHTDICMITLFRKKIQSFRNSLKVFLTPRKMVKRQDTRPSCNKVTER